MNWPFEKRSERKINRTNDDLVDRIERAEAYDCIGDEELPITDPHIIAAMRRVDRRMFIPEDAIALPYEYYNFGADVPADATPVPARACAYADLPVSIGNGMTCSQPSLVAYMIQLLEIDSGMKVLEIGSGCGYAATIIAELGARVVGLERVWQLYGLGQRNVAAHFGHHEFGHDGKKRVQSLWMNGFQGFPDENPYDRILISASSPEAFDPRILAKQLRDGTGIILFPRGNLVRQKYERNILVEKVYGPKVSFVPLVEEGKKCNL